ncbi:hypothetical protein GCM10010392_43730 [Streptomyces clavifer]|nr:hypothetical protein GCM10010392_43730 [Streptomyces clavifer]
MCREYVHSGDEATRGEPAGTARASSWTVLAVIAFFGEQVDGHHRALLESLSVRVAG